MAGTFIYLRVESEKLDFQELEDHLKTRPTTVRRKGERFEDKRFNKTITYKTDVWSFRMEAEEGTTAEELLDRFLDALEVDRAALRELSEHDDIDIGFYISAYPEEHHYNFSFSKERLRRICEFALPLEYTTQYLKEIYDNN